MNNENITINGVEYAPVSNMIPAPVEGTPIGQKCIVRTRDSGVWFGNVEAKDGRDATIRDARRLWYWKAMKGFTLSAVAKYGISEGKLPSPVPTVYLTETCEFIPVSSAADKILSEWEAHNE